MPAIGDFSMQDASSSEQAQAIQASPFGTIVLEDRHIVHFPEGLHGFEHLQKFVVIADETLVPFRWLLSIENPSIGFPILSPFQIDLSYTPEAGYDVQTSAPMVIVTLFDSEKQAATANMSAPIIFDMKEGTAKQVLIENSAYTSDYPLNRNYNIADETSAKRRIYTSQFGTLDITDSQIICFKDGILGFPELRDFVLVSEENMAPLEWLVSLENPSIGLPIINPWLVFDEYELRDHNPDKDAIYTVVTLGSRAGRMTVNLRAPVIIDPIARSGQQVILPSDKYMTEFPIGARSDT